MAKYEVCAGAGVWLRVDVFSDSVTIYDAHKVRNRAAQKSVCQAIKRWPDLPDCIQKRSWRSLRREWRAHGLLYRLPLLPSGWKERLKDVDLDNEPPIRRAAYFVLAIL